ncbi:helix-turn-helix transcriptional regulator [Streptosporangium sp. NPDC051023]|uniref:helix-turn-helix domain-containing protein n=1 Tax=Streptosporangium sp. NPDC051023 TaxID=3155410 RepID=UPI00344D8963
MKIHLHALRNALLCSTFLYMQTIRTRRRPLAQNPAAVRKHRLLKGFEQAELAELAGISPSHMSKIETGKASAGVRVLHGLAGALDCEVKELMAK